MSFKADDAGKAARPLSKSIMLTSGGVLLSGYAMYWNWSPDNPNRPFGAALEAFQTWRAEQRGDGPITNRTQYMIPVAASNGFTTSNEGVYLGPSSQATQVRGGEGSCSSAKHCG
jgi:hypothetical protein